MKPSMIRESGAELSILEFIEALRLPDETTFILNTDGGKRFAIPSADWNSILDAAKRGLLGV